MAFTLSHAVIAPLLYPVFRKSIPMASLAMGAMSPDLAGEIFNARDFAHSYTGLISIDLWVGLIGCLLWYTIYRPCVYAGLNREILPRERTWFDLVFYSVFGVLIGIFTHFLWDSFTHSDQDLLFAKNLLSAEFLWQPVQLPWLSKPLPLHLFMQYFTSLVTLPFLYFVIRPVLLAPKRTLNISKGLSYPMILVSIFLLSLLAAVINLWMHEEVLIKLSHRNTYFFVRTIFIEFSLGFMAVFSVLCLLFRLKIARVF